MRIILAALLLVSPSVSLAEVSMSVHRFDPPSDYERRVTWSRDGVAVLTQTFKRDGAGSLVLISPKGESPTNSALAIEIADQKITAICSRTGIANRQFAVDDFTKDGIPDFIQICDDTGSTVIEAYTIRAGVVEPLPEALFKDDRAEFYFDEAIIAFLKRADQKKAAEPGATDNPDDAQRLREDH